MSQCPPDKRIIKTKLLAPFGNRHTKAHFILGAGLRAGPNSSNFNQFQPIGSLDSSKSVASVRSALHPSMSWSLHRDEFTTHGLSTSLLVTTMHTFQSLSFHLFQKMVKVSGPQTDTLSTVTIYSNLKCNVVV